MAIAKRAFTVGDSLNTYYLGLLTEVARIVREENKNFSKTFNCLILENFGEAHEMTSWTDVGGYFLTFRIAPLDAHLPGAQAAATNVVKRFSKMLQLKKPPTVDHDTENHRYTVTIFNSENSRGD